MVAAQAMGGLTHRLSCLRHRRRFATDARPLTRFIFDFIRLSNVTRTDARKRVKLASVRRRHPAPCDRWGGLPAISSLSSIARVPLPRSPATTPFA